MPLKHAPASGPCGISGRFLAELAANDKRARFKARHAQRDVTPGVQNAAAATQGQLGVLAVVKAHPGAVGAGVGQHAIAHIASDAFRAHGCLLPGHCPPLHRPMPARSRRDCTRAKPAAVSSARTAGAWLWPC